jgi:mRNA interferase MazF
MKTGDITLAKIPQDLSGKLRPVLLLKQLPKYNDFLVCAITSQMHQYIDGFDLIINKTDQNFVNTGLLSSSVIRLGSLAVLRLQDLTGSIGYLETEYYQMLINNIIEYLKKS